MTTDTAIPTDIYDVLAKFRWPSEPSDFDIFDVGTVEEADIQSAIADPVSEFVFDESDWDFDRPIRYANGESTTEWGFWSHEQSPSPTAYVSADDRVWVAKGNPLIIFDVQDDDGEYVLCFAVDGSRFMACFHRDCFGSREAASLWARRLFRHLMQSYGLDEVSDAHYIRCGHRSGDCDVECDD